MSTNISVHKASTPNETSQPISLSPFIDLDQKLDEFEKRFESLIPPSMEAFFPHGWMHPSNWELPILSRNGNGNSKTLRVDVLDRDEDVVVRAEIPGVAKKDLELEATDTTLLIKGSTTEEKTETQKQFFKHEMLHGEFSRTVFLPTPVVGDLAKAKCSNGVLEVTIPKMEATKRHPIKVD